MTMAEIAAEVARAHGVTVDDIRGPRRWRKVAVARQEVYLRCLEATGYPASRIGLWLGGRDRKTVLHGAERARDRRP